MQVFVGDWIGHLEIDVHDLVGVGRAYVAVAAADARVVEKLGVVIVSSADLAYTLVVPENVRPTVAVDVGCSTETAAEGAVANDGMQ